MKVFIEFFVVTVFVQQSVASFQQNQYKVIHEKFVLVDYNKEYIDNPMVSLAKFNSSTKAFSGFGTLKADLSDEIWVYLKILQSTDGGVEYRPYPAKISLNVCEAQKKDTFGTRDIFQYGNLTDCPIKKGTYYVNDYVPDESKFPPYVPRGKLIVESKTYDRDIYLGTARWYGIVEDI